MEWTHPPNKEAPTCRCGITTIQIKLNGESTMKITTVGIDLAKNRVVK